MGLVLQAPADALMAILAAGQPNTSASPAPAGFAALMESLLGGMPVAGAKTSAADLLPLPTPDGDGDGDDATGVASELVAAALAALQATVPAVPDGTDSASGQASGKAALNTALPAGADIESAAASLPAESTVVSAETEEAPEAAVTTDIVPPPATETPAAAADVAPPNAPTQAVPETATTPTLLAAAVTDGLPPAVKGTDDDAPTDAHKPDKPTDSGAIPPGPSPQTPQVQISVVRSVGNAQQGTSEHGEKGDKQPSQPAPKASVQGIAHAAANSAVGQVRDAASQAPADAAAPSAPPAPQVPPAVEQVATTVIQQVEQGGGEAKIHLHPAELGDVVIHVHTDGDRVHLDIHAERADAMNLLRDHTADLSNLLGNRGLNLSDVYVGVGGQGAGDRRDEQPSGQRANTPANGEFAQLMGIDSAPAADNYNRLRAAYNPDGALSYRV